MVGAAALIRMNKRSETLKNYHYWSIIYFGQWPKKVAGKHNYPVYITSSILVKDAESKEP